MLEFYLQSYFKKYLVLIKRKYKTFIFPKTAKIFQAV